MTPRLMNHEVHPTKLSVTGVTQGSPYDHFSSSIGIVATVRRIVNREFVAGTLDVGSCAKSRPHAIHFDNGL
jgi:hypothetical protein